MTLMITLIKAGIKLEEGEATGAGEITLPLTSKVEGKHFFVYVFLSDPGKPGVRMSVRE